jgi:hypothetical protein
VSNQFSLAWHNYHVIHAHLTIAWKGMQAAALVKLGLLQWTSAKAFFGGACGQDWMWQPDAVLHAKFTELQRILQGPGSDIAKVSHLVRSLVGQQGLEIIRIAEGF